MNLFLLEDPPPATGENCTPLSLPAKPLGGETLPSDATPLADSSPKPRLKPPPRQVRVEGFDHFDAKNKKIVAAFRKAGYGVGTVFPSMSAASRALKLAPASLGVYFCESAKTSGQEIVVRGVKLRVLALAR